MTSCRVWALADTRRWLLSWKAEGQVHDHSPAQEAGDGAARARRVPPSPPTPRQASVPPVARPSVLHPRVGARGLPILPSHSLGAEPWMEGRLEAQKIWTWAARQRVCTSPFCELRGVFREAVRKIAASQISPPSGWSPVVPRLELAEQVLNCAALGRNKAKP